MAYARPAYNAADASFASVAVYALPPYSDADARFDESDPEAIVVAPSMLGAVSMLTTVSMAGFAAAESVLGEFAGLATVSMAAFVSAGSPLDEPAIVCRSSYAFIDVPSPLGVARCLGDVFIGVFVQVDSPLGAPACLAFSDVAPALVHCT